MSTRAAEFLTDLRVYDITEGRDTRVFEVAVPFRVYSAVLGAEITVPAGFVFDGESIPVWLQWLVPPFGQSKRGACVHDYLYQFGGFQKAGGAFQAVTRRQADDVYRELVTLKGLSKWRATMRWSVLRLVGWHAWDPEEPPEE